MLNIELMMEMGRRVQPDGNWWKPETAAMAREAAQDAGYCIDATNEIPAGSVAYEDLEDDLGGPLPTMLQRELHNV